MFISNDTRAFRFKTTMTSSSSVDTLNATRCGPDLLPGQKIGAGVRCGVGCNHANWHLNYCLSDLYRECQIGCSESMKRCQTRDWRRRDCRLSEVVHCETMVGSSRSLVGSILSQPCVLAVANAFDFPSPTTTK